MKENADEGVSLRRKHIKVVIWFDFFLLLRSLFSQQLKVKISVKRVSGWIIESNCIREKSYSQLILTAVISLFYNSEMINEQHKRTLGMKLSVKEYKWKEYQLIHLLKYIFQCASKHGQLFNKQFCLIRLILYFLDKRTTC